MSKKETKEEDITKYTKGTRMDDAYYFFKKPKDNEPEKEKDEDETE